MIENPSDYIITVPARLANLKLGKPRAFEVASQSIAAGIRVAAPLLASDSEDSEGEHENTSCQLANTKNPYKSESHESNFF